MSEEKVGFNPDYNSELLQACDALFGRKRHESGSGKYTAGEILQAIDSLRHGKKTFAFSDVPPKPKEVPLPKEEPVKKTFAFTDLDK